MEQKERNLTDDQREILNQFRIDLKDLLTPSHTDAELLKWLRARNFNLKKAEDHYREVTRSRITYGINTITDTYEIPQVIQKFRGDTFLGFAKDGSPIRYIKMAADFHGFLYSVPAYELILFFCYLMESDLKAKEEHYRKTGKKCDGITYVLDMDGLSIRNLSYKIVIESGLDSIRLFQDVYPECWQYILVVNAPYIFNKILNIFKPIIKDNLMGRTRSASKETTPELLREYIDEDVLPEFLGGKRVDSKGDPYCKEFINQAGTIPEKYYLRNSMHLIQDTDPGVKVVTIGARSWYNVSVVVRESPSQIRLEMRTENGGIVYSKLYREFGPDPENTDIPSSDEYLDPHEEKCNVKLVGARIRCQTHCAPTVGYANATNPGIYILHFDNTDSWFTSKKLFYRVTVFPQNPLSKHSISERNFS